MIHTATLAWQGLIGYAGKGLICHEPGATESENTPDVCCQQTPGLGQNRTMKYNVNPVKTTGATAAQTPSASASAPHQIGTLVGADPLSVTTANQSAPTVETTKQGGGQHAPV